MSINIIVDGILVGVSVDDLPSNWKAEEEDIFLPLFLEMLIYSSSSFSQTEYAAAASFRQSISTSRLTINHCADQGDLVIVMDCAN